MVTQHCERTKSYWVIDFLMVNFMFKGILPKFEIKSPGELVKAQAPALRSSEAAGPGGV